MIPRRQIRGARRSHHRRFALPVVRRGPITVLVKKLLILIDLEPRFANKGGVFRIVVLDVADTIDLYN